MIRFLTSLIWIAGSGFAAMLSLDMLGAGADLFTVSVFWSVAGAAGLIPATIFYGICRAIFGPHAPRVASSPKPRRSFSRGLFNPLDTLRLIIVGDPAVDALRAANYRYAHKLAQEERERKKLTNPNPGAVKRAGDRAVLQWLRDS